MIIIDQYSKKDHIKFHSKPREIYKGKYTSKAIIKLSKKFTGNICLDVGAGDGSLHKTFLKTYGRKKKIISIDLVPKRKYVWKGDCTDLRFEDRYFDTVFAIDIIEHLNNDDLNKCLIEINRVLKKGGYAIFNTINKENLEKSMIICPKCKYKFHRVGHSQVFSKKRLRHELKKRGFEIIKMRTINLELYSNSKMLADLIYWINLDKFVNEYNKDIFLIVKKLENL